MRRATRVWSAALALVLTACGGGSEEPAAAPPSRPATATTSPAASAAPSPSPTLARAAGGPQAHNDVFNLLLQVLDDGRLTDGQGRTVDFTNAVLILTSNLPGDPADFFKPEFINRIDEIVRFRALTEDDIAQVLEIQLRQLETRMTERKLTLVVSEDARRWLASRGYDPDYGARPLKRLIQHAIVDPLALELLSGVYRDGDTVHVDVAGDDLVLK